MRLSPCPPTVRLPGGWRPPRTSHADLARAGSSLLAEHITSGLPTSPFGLFFTHWILAASFCNTKLHPSDWSFNKWQVEGSSGDLWAEYYSDFWGRGGWARDAGRRSLAQGERSGVSPGPCPGPIHKSAAAASGPRGICSRRSPRLAAAAEWAAERASGRNEKPGGGGGRGGGGGEGGRPPRGGKERAGGRRGAEAARHG